MMSLSVKGLGPLLASSFASFLSFLRSLGLLLRRDPRPRSRSPLRLRRRRSGLRLRGRRRGGEGLRLIVYTMLIRKRF